MKPLKFVLAALAAATSWGAAFAPVSAATAPEIPEGSTLQSVLLFSRHGMRGPTEAVDCELAGQSGRQNACLNALGDKPWPSLDVAAGNLTAAGAERAATLGRYYRARYVDYGLLPAAECPAVGNVAFISDGVERTIVTAGAVMNGMFPGCFLNPLSVNPGLYTPPSSCASTPAQQSAAALSLIGGSWQNALNGPLKEPLAAMSKVIGPLQAEMCGLYKMKAGCTLADLPTDANPPAAVGILSQPTEQFIMQYGSGLPESKVGWGLIPSATGKSIVEGVREVNAIHAFHDWAWYYPPETAQLGGSQTLAVIADLLGQQESGKLPFIFLASHDNLILNVAGMLGLSWRLDGYQPNQVPPGGAIAVERWTRPDRAGTFVRMVYYAQTIEQLHKNTPLTLENPPASQVLSLAQCLDGSENACTWTKFQALTNRVVNAACVNPAAFGNLPN